MYDLELAFQSSSVNLEKNASTTDADKLEKISAIYGRKKYKDTAALLAWQQDKIKKVCLVVSTQGADWCNLDFVFQAKKSSTTSQDRIWKELDFSAAFFHDPVTQSSKDTHAVKIVTG